MIYLSVFVPPYCVAPTTDRSWNFRRKFPPSEIRRLRNMRSNYRLKEIQSFVTSTCDYSSWPRSLPVLNNIPRFLWRLILTSNQTELISLSLSLSGVNNFHVKIVKRRTLNIFKYFWKYRYEGKPLSPLWNYFTLFNSAVMFKIRFYVTELTLFLFKWK